MITQRLSAHDACEAGRRLREGQVVAFPTETVYGLGADAFNPKAVTAVFEAKGRPQDNPMIVHVARPEDAGSVALDFPPAAKPLMEAFWPGPLTLVLPRRPEVPDLVTAGLSTVAVRCPSHAVAQEILTAAGVPVAAPSANRSGRPSPTCAAHVLEDLDGRVDAVVDGGCCQCGLESTVLSLVGGSPTLLRPGGVSAQQLQAVIGPLVISDAVLRPWQAPDAPASPGMKYRHYAPRTPLVILRGTPDKAAAWLRERPHRVGMLCFDGERHHFRDFTHLSYGPEDRPAELGRRLYAALREADAWGCDRLYIRCPDDAAVQNRLMKAAGFQIENVE